MIRNLIGAGLIAALALSLLVADLVFWTGVPFYGVCIRTRDVSFTLVARADTRSLEWASYRDLRWAEAATLFYVSIGGRNAVQFGD